MSALSDSHRVRQRRLADLVGVRLTASLVSLDDLDEQSLLVYHDRAYPVVRGGQEHSARLGAALVSLTLRTGRALGDLSRALDATGVGVTTDSRSLVAPVLRARSLVEQGQTLREALTSASSYARSLSSNDLQAAQRVGMSEAADDTVRGWMKDVNPNCCEWCTLVGAERVYKQADTVPFHDNDNCSVFPVT